MSFVDDWKINNQSIFKQLVTNITTAVLKERERLGIGKVNFSVVETIEYSEEKVSSGEFKYVPSSYKVTIQTVHQEEI